jgi:hypothetical protein
MKKQIYSFSRNEYKNAEDYKYFSSYMEGNGDIVFLACNSLAKLKKELKRKKVSAFYFDILSCYKDGKKQDRPFLVSLYKPRGIV